MLKMKIPLIGIFWIRDDDGLILDTCPFDQGEDMIGNWANHSGHSPFWDKYSAKYGLTFDYVHYPRGRVVYNIKTKQFKIISSKQIIKNKKIIKKIARAFNLTKYILASDAHYENAYPLLDEEFNPRDE